MPVLQLYLQDEDERQRMKDLARWLDRNGVALRDNRGHLSLSKLVRFLVEQEWVRKESEGK